MAIVTVELRHLLLTDFKLFDFTYKISDSVWKTELEQAIIDYYFFEEIGQETPDRFKHVFRTKMQGIMEHYDKLHELYKTHAMTLANYKMTETTTKVKDRALKNSGTDGSVNTILTDSKNTDYPQHFNIENDIPSGRSVNNTQTNNAITFGSNQDEDVTETVDKVIEGFEGTTNSKMLAEYRNNMIRLNREIIQELKTCFILVY